MNSSNMDKFKYVGILLHITKFQSTHDGQLFSKVLLFEICLKENVDEE